MSTPPHLLRPLHSEDGGGAADAESLSAELATAAVAERDVAVAENAKLSAELDEAVACSAALEEDVARRRMLAVSAINSYWELGGTSVDARGLLRVVQQRLLSAQEQQRYTEEGMAQIERRLAHWGAMHDQRLGAVDAVATASEGLDGPDC